MQTQAYGRRRGAFIHRTKGEMQGSLRKVHLVAQGQFVAVSAQSQTQFAEIGRMLLHLPFALPCPTVQAQGITRIGLWPDVVSCDDKPVVPYPVGKWGHRKQRRIPGV